MAYQLLKFALGREYNEPRFFRDCQTPKKSYDAIIIGGGGHGLAAAYYLAKDHGITNVAVLERGYIGGGNTGRNTTIVRSNYLTPDGVNFYDASVKLFEGLSTELDINLFYSNRGHFTL
ncbi:MAG: FAD-dependent oxidoreductase, partial [Nitrosomonadales bacterium]|nr:FAD-dependent oxidoreductase [Nitrosomonadales bacterium]